MSDMYHELLCIQHICSPSEPRLEKTNPRRVHSLPTRSPRTRAITRSAACVRSTNGQLSGREESFNEKPTVWHVQHIESTHSCSEHSTCANQSSLKAFSQDIRPRIWSFSPKTPDPNMAANNHRTSICIFHSNSFGSKNMRTCLSKLTPTIERIGKHNSSEE